MQNNYTIKSLFSRWMAVLVMVAFASISASAQTPYVLFKQDFSSSTTVSSYVNLNTPSTGQFNGITSSTGSSVSITGNALRFTRSTGGAASFSRTTDLSPLPKTLSYQFTLNAANTAATNSAAVFQVGSGMATTNAAAAAGNTYGRFAIDFKSSNSFSIRNMATATASATFTGTQTITWTLNNTGVSISYTSPAGITETLANDRMDIYVGTTKVWDDITTLSSTLDFTDLKFILQAGTGSLTIDNIDVTYAIPHLECPSSGPSIVSTDPGSCTADYTPTPPTVYNARSANAGTMYLSIDYGSTYLPLSSTFNGQDVYPEGGADFYWQNVDALGNTNSCIRSIIVQDNEAPIFLNSQATASYNRNVNNGVCNYTITAADSANFDRSDVADNCVDVALLAPTVNLTGAYTASNLTTLTGVVLPVGTTTATWSVDDGTNTRTQTYTIVVTDNQLPVISGTPSNIVQQRSCAGAVTWTAPTAADNCGIQSFTSTHNSGASFPVGTTTVTYTATDVNGNVQTASFTVTINQLTASAVGTDVTCNGAGNGSINLSVSNVATTASYLWSNGATTEDISSLVPGTYSVIVTDGGCSTTATATIAQPAVLTASTTQTNVTCNGLSNGAIDLTVAGGNTPYTYVWSNGATSQDISNVVSGTYSVTVTDSKGCVTTATATITAPAVLTATAVSSGNILCFSSTATITVSAVGGTGPYTGTGANTVTAGTYNYTVTDANGCTAAANSVTVLYYPISNVNTGVGYNDIQVAINAATAGDTINVCAGTYSQDIVVSKPLTLRGAQHGVKATGSARSGGESLINGTGSGSSFVVRVDADSVTIDGFSINPRINPSNSFQFARDAVNIRSTHVAKPGDPTIGAYRTNIAIKNNWIYSNIGSLIGQQQGMTFGESPLNNNPSAPLNAEVANVTITGNYINMVTTASSSGPRGMVLGNQFQGALSSGGNASIYYNNFLINDNTVIASNTTLFQSQTRTRLNAMTITNNQFSNSRTGVSIAATMTNSNISGNLVQDVSAGSGMTLCLVNSTANNNTIRRVAGSGLVISGGRSTDITYFAPSSNSTVSGNIITYNDVVLATGTDSIAAIHVQPDLNGSGVSISGTTGAVAGSINATGNSLIDGAFSTSLNRFAIRNRSV
ncbi:MAG: HYR domain-containing protein, partial [Bacteroidota bacterium]